MSEDGAVTVLEQDSKALELACFNKYRARKCELHLGRQHFVRSVYSWEIAFRV